MTSRREFTHLLLTRFNTAVGYAPSAKRLDAEWLNRRLALFEQYCLPSVAAQQGAEFRWLVFFDAESPNSFKTRIATFEPLVTPIYIEGQANDEVIRRHVLETGLISTPHLITTRLDNDDGLARHHLELVQHAYRGQKREFITFPIGFQSYRDHLYYVYWPSNPFLSLIEEVGSRSQFTTVFCIAHDHLQSAGDVRQLRLSPQWLQVLHSSNLLNELRGGWPKLEGRSHHDFAVEWSNSVGDDSVAQRLVISAAAYSKRAMRFARKSMVPIRERRRHKVAGSGDGIC
jgi:hypothetical protein